MSHVHVLDIPGFRPALANELVGRHWRQVHRLKRRDRDQIGLASILAGAPKAIGKRRVCLEISGPFRRRPDPDAAWKSVLDALVNAAMLTDDSAAWCEIGEVVYLRADRYRTRIFLEELDR